MPEAAVGGSAFDVLRAQDESGDTGGDHGDDVEGPGRPSFPEFVASCKEAGADVIELSGWPVSCSQTLAPDDEGVERVRTLTRWAGRRVRMRDVSPLSLSIPPLSIPLELFRAPLSAGEREVTR